MKLLRLVLPATAIVALVLFAGSVLDGGGPAEQQSVLSLPGAGEQDGTQTQSAPTPTPPCPACDQDENTWRSLTDVPPPELLGQEAALVEACNGALLYGLHADRRVAPASLAKIATALVVRRHAHSDEVVPITINGWDLAAEDGSSIVGIEAGMRLTVEELLYGLLLPSGNDAALALAEYLGGEDYMVAEMNRLARDLGLRDTNFASVHGLDAPDQYSTPFELAVLGRELLRDPYLRAMVSTQYLEFDWSENGIWNGNYLIYIYDGAIGIKTGYTEEAGWVIVAAAEREGRLLIASVMKSADVYWDALRLFDWAWENLPPQC